jgi:hypothetical protein
MPSRLLYSDFKSPVTLTAGTNTGNRDQYLRNGGWGTPDSDPEYPSSDFTLWGCPDTLHGYILTIVGAGTTPVSDYSLASLKSAADRNGVTRQLLSLHIKQDSPNTGVEQVTWENVNPTEEPVYYCRMYWWCDADLATRMAALDPNDRWAMVVEFKANPDYRMRIQLYYNATEGKCYWHTQGDVLTNADALWEASSNNSFYARPGEWHCIEYYINRDAPRWKVMIDGKPLIDKTSGSLRGATEPRLSAVMFCNAYGVKDTPPGGSMIGGEYRIGEIDLWDGIPWFGFKPGAKSRAMCGMV